MKSILVTGSSSGIGAAICEHFSQIGWRVFGSVRNINDGEKLKEICGENFSPLIFDVTDLHAIKNAVHLVESQLGDNGLDCLVNNAGINISGPMEYVDTDEVRTVFEVNVMGPLNCSQLFLPVMKKSSAATIINISSMAGKIGLPMQGSYCGSKFALEGISESMRRELQIHNIKVIVIGPGAIESSIWDKFEKDEKEEIYKDTEYALAINKMDDTLKMARSIAIPAKSVALRVEKILLAKNPKHRYVVAGITDKLLTLIPSRVLDYFFKKRLMK